MVSTISHLFKTSKLKSGILLFSGGVSGTTGGIWVRWINAAIIFSGSAARLLNKLRQTSGQSVLTGGYNRLCTLNRILSSTLLMTGQVIISRYSEADWRLGFLDIIGNTSRNILIARSSLAGSLVLGGSSVGVFTISKDATGGLSFSGSSEGYKDILYYGPELG
jgi:hypothetical protein